jgi:hypothetical protein
MVEPLTCSFSGKENHTHPEKIFWVQVADSSHLFQACLKNAPAALNLNSNKRILRVVKVLRILKIIRLLRAVQVVE